MGVNPKNNVNLIGRLGEMPQANYFDSGVCKVTASLATSERYKAKSGEWTERTSWHRIEIWGASAEFFLKYTQKGTMVAIVGKLDYDTWTDKHTNAKRQKAKVLVSAFNIIADRKAVAVDKVSSQGTQVATAESGSKDRDDLPF